MALAVLVTACSTQPGRAPVEERMPSGATARPAQAPTAAARPAVALPSATGQAGPLAQGAPNTASSSPSASASTGAAAGSSSQSSPAAPGTYTVKPGDTLIRIGLDHGQNWRDIARWSGLENPNLIEVGQVLRVSPPGQDSSMASAAASRPVALPGRMESRPLESRPADAAAPAVAYRLSPQQLRRRPAPHRAHHRRKPHRVGRLHRPRGLVKSLWIGPGRPMGRWWPPLMRHAV